MNGLFSSYLILHFFTLIGSLAMHFLHRTFNFGGRSSWAIIEKSYKILKVNGLNLSGRCLNLRSHVEGGCTFLACLKVENPFCTLARVLLLENQNHRAY